MNCETISRLMSSVLDGELTATQRAQFDRHLEQCEACRQTFADLQSLDAGLARILRKDPLDRVTAQILDKVASRADSVAFSLQDRGLTAARFRRSNHSALGILMALLATVLVTVGTVVWLAKAPPSVAEMTFAKGVIEVRNPNTANWTAIDGKSGIALAAHARIRTRDDSLCEVRTGSDALVRMNRDTEMVVHDTQQIELVRGELWCRTPTTKSLEISKSKKSAKTSSDEVFTCPSSCETQWQSSAGDELRCMAVSERPIALKVSPSHDTCVVTPGDSVTFTMGHAPSPQGRSDLLQALTWQLPLLILRSPNDQELQQRLTQLLAAFGHSKMAWLYEEQIRQLGPPGTIPLIAFVRSANPSEDANQRHRAMSIVADLAPASTLPDLEALCTDGDPIVRQLAIRAVQRLKPERRFDEFK